MSRRRSRVLMAVGMNDIRVRWSADDGDGQLCITGPFTLAKDSSVPPPMDGDTPVDRLLHDDGTWLFQSVDEDSVREYLDRTIEVRDADQDVDDDLGDEIVWFDLWATWKSHPLPQFQTTLAMLVLEHVFSDPAWMRTAPSPCESEFLLIVPLSAPWPFTREFWRAAEAHGFKVVAARHDLDALVAGLQTRGVTGRVRVASGPVEDPDWILDLSDDGVAVSSAPGPPSADLLGRDPKLRSRDVVAGAWAWWHDADPDRLGAGAGATVLGVRVGDGDEGSEESGDSSAVLWTGIGFPGGADAGLPHVSQYARVQVPREDMSIRFHLVHGVPGMPAASACSLWRSVDLSTTDEALRFDLTLPRAGGGCDLEVTGLREGPVRASTTWDFYCAPFQARLGTREAVRSDVTYAVSGMSTGVRVGYDLVSGEALVVRDEHVGGRSFRWRGRVGNLLVQATDEDPPMLADTWDLREAAAAMFGLLSAEKGGGRRAAWVAALWGALDAHRAPVPCGASEIAVVVPYGLSLEMYGRLASSLSAGGWQRVLLLFPHEAVALAGGSAMSLVRGEGWAIPTLLRRVDESVTLVSPAPDAAGGVQLDAEDIGLRVEGAVDALAEGSLARQHVPDGLIFASRELRRVLPTEARGRRVSRIRSRRRHRTLPLLLRFGSEMGAPWIIGPSIPWPMKQKQLTIIGSRKSNGESVVGVALDDAPAAIDRIPEDLLA